MPKFTYTGNADRYYPTLGLTPVPGESYDLDTAPTDGRWVAAKHAKSTPAVTEEK